MSCYYTYYLGYEKDGKINPLGLYDYKGKLHEVFSRSRSFASDLHYDFYDVPEKMVGDALRKEFECGNIYGEKSVDVKYLPLSDLGDSNYIVSGFFPLSAVSSYLRNSDEWERISDIEYERLSPEEYALRLITDDTAVELDCEGEVITHPPIKSYVRFSYPNYYSREYEVSLLKNAADPFEYSVERNGAKIVILETEG